MMFVHIPTADGISPGTSLTRASSPYHDGGIDRDTVLKRYLNVLSEEQKEFIWKGSRYSILSGVSTWKEFKEIYYDL